MPWIPDGGPPTGRHRQRNPRNRRRHPQPTESAEHRGPKSTRLELAAFRDRCGDLLTPTTRFSSDDAQGGFVVDITPIIDKLGTGLFIGGS